MEGRHVAVSNDDDDVVVWFKCKRNSKPIATRCSTTVSLGARRIVAIRSRRVGKAEALTLE